MSASSYKTYNVIFIEVVGTHFKLKWIVITDTYDGEHWMTIFVEKRIAAN
jgi:hypothetical protein